MIIAIVDNLQFNCDPSRHTVFYAEHCRTIAYADYNAMLGTFKAVIAEDDEEAVKLLGAQIKKWLTTEIVWGPVNPADFTFGFRSAEVNDKHFWLIPSRLDCRQYPVTK